MQSTGQILGSIVNQVRVDLEQIPDADARIRPAPGAWSPKEILGHLIDSATNNHRRFVLATVRDDLVFEGYRQDMWVSLQGYQEQDWPALIAFWSGYNHHLATLIDRIPDDVKQRPRVLHNLHRIAWKTVPEYKATTLEYFIQDYIGHLEHHLMQIVSDYEPVMIGTYES